MTTTAAPPAPSRQRAPKPDPKDDPHGYAQAHLGAKLADITDQFRQLEVRLRQPYARTLTDTERQAIRAFLEVRADRIDHLLARPSDSAPFSWTSAPSEPDE